MKIVLLLLLVAACSKKEKAAGPVVGSCQSSPALCEQYEGDAKYVGRQKDACGKGSTWTDAPCATANVIGSCRESHGWTRTRHHYRGIEGQANPAVEKAKAECGAYGTWVEPSP